MDADSGCVSEVYVLCRRLLGMLNTARNDSLSHRDANWAANWAAEALMLPLRGELSSSFRAVYILSSYCAIAAAFSFAILCNFILGGSKWDNNEIVVEGAFGLLARAVGRAGEDQNDSCRWGSG